MEYAQEYARGDGRLHREMREKAPLRETFFGLKAEPQRPLSVATEFMDVEWDDDVLSELEDNSPRISVNSSSGQPSITTLSSYDEVPTPRSSQDQMAFPEAQLPRKPIEGPMGPHLFRASTDSYFDDAILTLSPITPKTARPFDDFRYTKLPPPPVPRQQNGPFRFAYEDLESRELVSWTPEMVAQSMLDAGIELSVAGRFVENDINGPILITLKFEDLKELDIPSFGMRTRVWNQIQLLRDSRPSSPRAPTPIQDEPSREVKKEAREMRSVDRRAERPTDDCSLKRRKSSRRRPKKASHDDIITPMESVSIVGIEQVVPKPHHCPKGENCSRYKKQQRLIEAFRKEHPFVDLEKETVVITGNPGNPETARALDPKEILRPISDAVPSVVASSDVLGPGNATPLQFLQEATLRNVAARDPQDNVRQFLDFQKRQSNTVPPTPPFEMGVPAMKAQPDGLRKLPKLSIPGKQAPRPSNLRASTVPPVTQPERQPERRLSSPQQTQGFVPYVMDRAEAMSPDLQSPVNPYRFGTPFSEMDVPVTAIPMDRVARDVSQSVPPEMNYRPGTAKQQQQQQPLTRTQSRSSARRPSFPVLPALDENAPTPIARTSPLRTSPLSPRSSTRTPQQPLQAPPRVNYPWSPVERTHPYEQAIPPISHLAGAIPVKQAAEAAQQDGVTFQGPMKKRKTKMLRHEWNDTFCTLKGTRLAVHKDERTVDRTLEYVDIDDYAIACSSLASQSKLSAAFRAVHFSSHSREKSDPVAAFSFQLIPQDKNAAKLRKRESALQASAHHHHHHHHHQHSASTSSVPAEGSNGTGKTHHFAVKSRDERIDWMRELMLAKAMRQKGEGFEVSVNGNMI
ncbi:Protein pob1 [Colletotrichum orbiculare MAFF 240422]|uniref:Protein pob1 n=1 Tax=Colletotrichum orbiculare (strain 104-T / ATCC 96160 / CBS 514.97 / LARS 414 / MAFF 240422) TaxID=1213857 RepID=N4VJU6_COLOR|nr:Protein pob1 [Colletotrichum orbiculare MAFF 240422]